LEAVIINSEHSSQVSSDTFEELEELAKVCHLRVFMCPYAGNGESIQFVG